LRRVQMSHSKMRKMKIIQRECRVAIRAAEETRKSRVGLDPLDTLGNVLLQLREGSLEKLLLLGRDLAETVDLLDTVGTEFDAGGEEAGELRVCLLDVGALDDTLLAVQSADEVAREYGGGVGHGESSRSGTVLGLDDLVTTELDAVDQLLVLLTRLDGRSLGDLGEEGNDSDTGVATDDGDVDLGGSNASDAGEESVGAGDVEGGDTEQALGVVDASALEDLSNDGDSGVDGVRDDEEVSLWRNLGGRLGEVTDDGRVGVEQVVTGHSRLAGNTGRDNDDLDVLERSLEAALGSVGGEARDLGGSVDVADIGSDTGSEADIVQPEVGDLRVLLQEECERLADTTCGTEDSDLAVGGSAGRESASHSSA